MFIYFGLHFNVVEHVFWMCVFIHFIYEIIVIQNI